jgi:hypothetical protein
MRNNIEATLTLSADFTKTADGLKAAAEMLSYLPFDVDGIEWNRTARAWQANGSAEVELDLPVEDDNEAEEALINHFERNGDLDHDELDRILIRDGTDFACPGDKIDAAELYYGDR